MIVRFVRKLLSCFRKVRYFEGTGGDRKDEKEKQNRKRSAQAANDGSSKQGRLDLSNPFLQVARQHLGGGSSGQQGSSNRQGSSNPQDSVREGGMVVRTDAGCPGVKTGIGASIREPGPGQDTKDFCNIALDISDYVASGKSNAAEAHAATIALLYLFLKGKNDKKIYLYTDSSQLVTNMDTLIKKDPCRSIDAKHYENLHQVVKYFQNGVTFEWRSKFENARADQLVQYACNPQKKPVRKRAEAGSKAVQLDVYKAIFEGGDPPTNDKLIEYPHSKEPIVQLLGSKNFLEIVNRALVPDAIISSWE
ncbi:unnamed protein product, partial [Mesorhabditis belari]|uniref:RNase H type-1 domain-containing protein n=1 Tax=Mesorhabditis belari TaxID=2138241 RepID=A0AAF3EKE6_9BILA